MENYTFQTFYAFLHFTGFIFTNVGYWSPYYAFCNWYTLWSHVTWPKGWGEPILSPMIFYTLDSTPQKADREQMLQSARAGAEGDNYQQFTNEAEGP